MFAWGRGRFLHKICSAAWIRGPVRCGVLKGAAVTEEEAWQMLSPQTKTSLPPGPPPTRFSCPTASSRFLLGRMAAAWKQTDLRVPQLPANATSSDRPGRPRREQSTREGCCEVTAISALHTTVWQICLSLYEMFLQRSLLRALFLNQRTFF